MLGLNNAQPQHAASPSTASSWSGGSLGLTSTTAGSERSSPAVSLFSSSSSSSSSSGSTSTTSSSGSSFVSSDSDDTGSVDDNFGIPVPHIEANGGCISGFAHVVARGLSSFASRISRLFHRNDNRVTPEENEEAQGTQDDVITQKLEVYANTGMARVIDLHGEMTLVYRNDVGIIVVDAITRDVHGITNIIATDNVDAYIAAAQAPVLLAADDAMPAVAEPADAERDRFPSDVTLRSIAFLGEPTPRQENPEEEHGGGMAIPTAPTMEVVMGVTLQGSVYAV